MQHSAILGNLEEGCHAANEEKGHFQMFSFSKTHSAEPSITVARIGFNDSVLWWRHLAWVWQLLRSLPTIFPAASDTFRTSGHNHWPHSHYESLNYGLDFERWLMDEAIVYAHFLHGTTVSPLAFNTNFFFGPQRHKLKSATFGRLGSTDHLLPFNVQARSLPGTCATDWRHCEETVWWK